MFISVQLKTDHSKSHLRQLCMEPKRTFLGNMSDRQHSTAYGVSISIFSFEFLV